MKLEHTLKGFVGIFLSLILIMTFAVNVQAEEDCDAVDYLETIREIRRKYSADLNQEFTDPLHEGAWRYFALIQFRDSLFQIMPSTIPECAWRYHGLLIGWVLVKSDWTYYKLLNLAAGNNRFIEPVNIYAESERQQSVTLGEEYKRFGQ